MPFLRADEATVAGRAPDRLIREPRRLPWPGRTDQREPAAGSVSILATNDRITPNVRVPAGHVGAVAAGVSVEPPAPQGDRADKHLGVRPRGRAWLCS